MDRQTQSFLDLSAKDDLAALVANNRAAWLWSADGAKVLWANSAGAAFFSAHSVADLTDLTSLERSPARPHIARIATSGMNDRFTIERLRFYRGLRVMLLTCQCKKIDLESGDSAALIVCGDKGLSSTKDPVSTFAHFLATGSTTVFVSINGAITETIGALNGTPEDLSLPDEQTALFGPLDLDGTFHNGVVLQASSSQKLIVLDNEPLSNDPGNGFADEDLSGVKVLGAVAAGDLPTFATDDTVAFDGEPGEINEDPEVDRDDAPVHSSASDNIDDTDIPTGDNAARLIMMAEASLDTATDTHSIEQTTMEDVPVPVTETAEESEATSEVAEADEDGELDDAVDVPTDEGPGGPVDPDGSKDTEISQDDLEDASAEIEPEAEEGVEEFIFQPHRRPIRFAWKMDINQRFTFLSDEFSDVLGPAATDILGLTWTEVSEKFDLDPRAVIARALDRRDTWSGKTVNWPVSGASLRVPVDMAALPAFDRNRKFEGYRGFGVCRTAEAQQDPNGLQLSPAMAAFDQSFTDHSADETAPDDIDVEDGDAFQEEIATSEVELATNPPELSSEDTQGDDTPEPEFIATDEEAPDPTASTPEGDTAADAGSAVAAENTVDDLKPAPPNSLAGRTFIGASAAAVVGTLAKFTSRSSDPVITKSTESPDTAADHDNVDHVAAEADPGTDETVVLDEMVDETAQTAPSGETTEQADFVDDHENATDDTLSDDESVNAASEDHVEPDEFVDVDERTPTTVAKDTGPVGISGSAPLDPSEIESAVKSLAKSYNNAPKTPRDLFDENENPSATALLEEHSSEQDNEASGPTDDRSDPDPSDDLFEPDTTEAPSDDQIYIAPTAENDDTRPEAQIDDAPTDDPTSDEREFFEETAAFEAEDKAAGTNDTPPEDSEPVQRTGQVIPLATARPRVVPVDTSSLSRPERQAFRKIAEALGARLEGDLEEFEGPDQSDDLLDNLPPEIPETGPIDPSLLDRLPIGIAIVNDREVLYGNKALLKLLGYESIIQLSEAGGLEALFIDDSEDLPNADGMDGEVDEPMKVRLADGGIRCVDAHMHSVPWNETRGLMISITERTTRASAAETPTSANFFAEVRSELEGARNQIAEMDTILETATDGVLILDHHGTIVKVNGSAEALFSANRVDMIGVPFTEFLAPESHRAAADYLDGLSRNGVASILNDGREVLGTVPSGGLIPLFMTMGRITNTKDEAKYCAVLRDITQWKTAEEELTKAKRQAENASSQKSDFLAKISHEIRTPLNAIIGFSEVMMEERFGDIGNDRYKDYLKDIRTSGSHIMSLINDLLDLSKIEAGKLDLKFVAVSTNEVINECVALMQPQANRERVIIRASLPDSVPNVVADPRSLRQIILNLLSNAIKYNKSGGQVILSTVLESNGEVAVRVRDTGTGMTAKQLTAALEPFRQLHTASSGGGTGLGLPLTKALVEANRAHFHIDSTPDQGTLVEVTFPTQRVLSE